jgi:hypothetical protein
LSSLYDDLEEARAQLACKAVDKAPPGSAPPMRSSTCQALAANWTVGRSLLNQCLASAQAPKAATFAADCQAFRDQLAAYQATVSPAVRLGPDTANRVGEIKARVLTLIHTYQDRFMPSVPATGFPAELILL